jgi:hypothetical protein
MASSPRSTARMTPAQRRRQRSVRLTVASALIAVAAVLTAIAVGTQSVVLLNVAAVGAVVLGGVAARIVYAELVVARRAHQADRTAQAKAYRAITDQRVAEQQEFAGVMTERLASSVRTVRELESTLVLAERRVAESEQKASTAQRRANAAEGAVSELREALEARVAELAAKADEVRAHAEQYADEFAGTEEAALYAQQAETIVDLLAWDERTRGAVTTPAVRKHA